MPAYVSALVNLLFGYGVATSWLSQRRLPARFVLLALAAAVAHSVAGGVVGRVPAELAFVTVVALTIGIGTTVHWLVERPLLVALGRHAPARRD